MPERVVRGPDGKSYSFPDDASDSEILMFFSDTPGANPAFKDAPMETSRLPGAVQTLAKTLPVIGGLAGGIALAPSFAGAVAGGGLGAAAGESARQSIESQVFGEGPSPVSGEGLKQALLAGGLGAVSEIPAAFAIGRGKSLLTKMGRQARASGERGSVRAGINIAAPRSMTSRGIKDTILKSREELGAELSKKLSEATGQGVNPDLFMAPARQQAANVASAEPSLRVVKNQVERALASARLKSGIEKGKMATPEQVWKFQQELQAVFSRDPTAATAATASQVNQILRDTYGLAGQVLRKQVPEAGELLTKLRDLHAAEAGLKYGINTPRSLAISAAANPRTAAALSPAFSGGLAVGGEKAIETMRSLLRRREQLP